MPRALAPPRTRKSKSLLYAGGSESDASPLLRHATMTAEVQANDENYQSSGHDDAAIFEGARPPKADLSYPLAEHL